MTNYDALTVRVRRHGDIMRVTVSGNAALPPAERYNPDSDDDRQTVAEYRLTPGHERGELAAMRRAIARHLAEPGGSVGNYNW